MQNTQILTLKPVTNFGLVDLKKKNCVSVCVRVFCMVYEQFTLLNQN